MRTHTPACGRGGGAQGFPEGGKGDDAVPSQGCFGHSGRRANMASKSKATRIAQPPESLESRLEASGQLRRRRRGEEAERLPGWWPVFGDEVGSP